MKPRTIAAIAIAAATSMSLISCSWFASKKKAISPYEKIAGSWQYSIDTTHPSIGKALLALAKKDSLPWSVELTKDSIFYIVNGKDRMDSGKYEIDTSRATLYVKTIKGAVEDSFHVKHFSDSLLDLSAFGKDSTLVKLTR